MLPNEMLVAADAVGGLAKKQRVHGPEADSRQAAGCASHGHAERAGEESSCSSQCMGSCGRGDREEEAAELGCFGCTRASRQGASAQFLAGPAAHLAWVAFIWRAARFDCVCARCHGAGMRELEAALAAKQALVEALHSKNCMLTILNSNLLMRLNALGRSLALPPAAPSAALHLRISLPGAPASPC